VPEYLIGKTAIPYQVSEKKRLTRKSLTLGRELLEVNVPIGTTTEEIELFLKKKQSWIIEQWHSITAKTTINPWPDRFMTGAKVLYLGRYTCITVTATDCNKLTIRPFNGFHIEVPHNIAEADRYNIIKDAFEHYLTNNLKQIINNLIDSYTPKLGAIPSGYRITKASRYWGYCDPEGTLQFNWQLIFAPQHVIRYVVVHELSHLIHRDHSDAFWMQVAALLPDYGVHKVWLDRDGRYLEL
jgi:predicted metal-dependent hydrolase